MDAAGALDRFPDFCARTTISSKDFGLTGLQLWAPQRYVLAEIAQGLADGVHVFYILKGRQLGVSTELLALDLYWTLCHPGIQGQVIFDSDDNEVVLRESMNEMFRSLPKAWRVPVLRNNRDILLLANRSRLMFQCAGTRRRGGKGKAIGQGRGINFIHGMELSSWGDEVAVRRLTSAFSDRHPFRLYVYEASARGYNLWYDLWTDAQEAVSIRPIFVGWWRHELNRLDPGGRAFKVYWTGTRTPQERVWCQIVRKQYGVELTNEQLAWWRYALKEKHQGDEALMHQENPTLPEDAFQATGSDFITPARLRALLGEAKDASPMSAYVYQFGATIDDETTQILPVRSGRAELLVWDEPVRGGGYVVSGDPAYGANPDSDNCCAQVWRADGNRLVQVAEAVSNRWTMKLFAWVLAHLCGAYPEALLICELTGPGHGTWDELNWLTQFGWGFHRRPAGNLLDMLGNIRHYLWRRTDSLSGQVAYQWKSNPNERERIMGQLHGEVEAGNVIVRSVPLVEELRGMRREGGDVRAAGRARDDRVMTAAMAVEAWKKWIVPDLQVPTRGAAPPPGDALTWTVRTFLDQVLRQPVAVED